MVNNKSQIPCQKIISGGQTGVDRAALDICLHENFPCGGWCPKGRIAEDGIIPAKYPLQELRQTEYHFRTEKNIEESDGTLIIAEQKLYGGTLLTRQLANKKNKALLCIHSESQMKQVFDWLIRHKIKTLNVAGPRKSQWEKGYSLAYEIIGELIRKIKS